MIGKDNRSGRRIDLSRRKIIKNMGVVGVAGVVGSSDKVSAERTVDKTDSRYVMSYFRTSNEPLHLATIKDGYKWNAINNNHPILRSHLSAERIRDPYIMQDHAGTYHLLGTDGWTSQSVFYAQSEDLLNWSKQKMIPVMTDISRAENAWAPEAYYDREAGVYRLLWASSVGSQKYPKGNRIWSCTTKNFETFSSSSELFFDPGYPVIDSTVEYLNGVYHMVFKDEREYNGTGTDYKALRTATANEAKGPYENISNQFSPHLVEGPTLIRRDGSWVVYFDHFLAGYMGSMKNSDFDGNWESITEKMDFPEGVRHPTVLPVSPRRWGQLQSSVRST